MQTHQPARIVVESEGVWCPPTPLTDLFRAWRAAKMNDVIELWATEPSFEEDVRAWAKKSGNRVLGVTRHGGRTRVLVQVTRRGKEIAGRSATRANFNDPDETKVTPKARLRLVTVGGFTMGLRTLEPGWRWSVSMQPAVGKPTCEIRHLGYVMSGRMGFLMNDGTELEVGQGDAFDVRPGHDAWTVGDAPVVFIDLIGAVEREGNPAGPRQGG